MDDLVIDVAPVRRWQSAMRALARTDLLSPAGIRRRITVRCASSSAAGIRRRIEERGEDPVRAAVGYLEALVSGALDAAIDDLDPVALGRALLAEELLLILTGSGDVDAVRAWLRAREVLPPRPKGGAEEARGEEILRISRVLPLRKKGATSCWHV